MRLIHCIDALREALQAPGGDVALVPTMGNLHAGHLALVGAARATADVVVATAFVNPLQFGPNEDLASYPRTPDEDHEALAEAGVDLVFAPSEEAMYPRGRDCQTRVHVPYLSDILCGEKRPGHFDGVATVVLKLLNLVAPRHAFFGEKDYQQLTLIRHLVADLDLPIEIHGVPTVRAGDGLALSSRNRYLSESERAVAPTLYATLAGVAEALARGADDVDGLAAAAATRLERAGFVPDYLTIREAERLAPATAGDRRLVVLGAARLGRARLIDNVRVERDGS